MINVSDIVNGFRAEELLSRVKLYRDVSRFDSKYFSLYASQLRIYHRLKDSIVNVQIVERLSELESEVLR